MQSHRLIVKDRSLGAQWRLEWNDSRLWLKDPDGQPQVEADPAAVHRVVDLYALYALDEVRFSIMGPPVFRADPAVIAKLRCLMDAGLAADSDFRAQELRRSKRSMAMLLVSSGLFILCFEFAFRAPPPDGWMRLVIPLLWITLMALFVVVGVSVGVAYRALFLWIVFWRIERTRRRS